MRVCSCPLLYGRGEPTHGCMRYVARVCEISPAWGLKSVSDRENGGREG